MTSKLWKRCSLISRIPSLVSGVEQPIKIVPSGFGDIVEWQRQVHEPFIRPLQRIGSDWNWPRTYLGCVLAEKPRLRKLLAFQVRVCAKGRAVPIAQAIVTLPYAWPGDSARQGAFLWFVAGTPGAALDHFGVSDRFKTLPVVLDTVIQLSRAAGLEGRLGLHAAEGADEQQGAELMGKYLELGLLRRPAATGFFRAPHRTEDGRLLYFTSELASLYSFGFDHLRS